MTIKRRRFTAEFKRKVALEALRGDRTVQAIPARHGVHPNQVSASKGQAIDGLDEVFAGRGSKGATNGKFTVATNNPLTTDTHFECILPGRSMARLAGK